MVALMVAINSIIWLINLDVNDGRAQQPGRLIMDADAQQPGWLNNLDGGAWRSSSFMCQLFGGAAWCWHTSTAPYDGSLGSWINMIVDQLGSWIDERRADAQLLEDLLQDVQWVVNKQKIRPQLGLEPDPD
jgi:hypothetical protein